MGRGYRPRPCAAPGQAAYPSLPRVSRKRHYAVNIYALFVWGKYIYRPGLYGVEARETYRTTQGYDGTGCHHHHRSPVRALECARRATSDLGQWTRPYYVIRESDGATVTDEGCAGLMVWVDGEPRNLRGDRA
jgi:hypothetical protein